jgi:hypothetical protein
MPIRALTGSGRTNICVCIEAPLLLFRRMSWSLPAGSKDEASASPSFPLLVEREAKLSLIYLQLN